MKCNRGFTFSYILFWKNISKWFSLNIHRKDLTSIFRKLQLGRRSRVIITSAKNRVKGTDNGMNVLFGIVIVF
jgi:hypothetical protein